MYAFSVDYALLKMNLAINMNKTVYNSCPLCGSSSIYKKFTCKDYFTTGEYFNIFECKECHFQFTQDIPDEISISTYYDSPAYVSHSNTSKGIINGLYHIVRTIMLRRKVSLVKKLTFMKHGKLLDYGAGTGYFAHAMQSAGWEVTAIEKSEHARKFAEDKFAIRMLSPQDIEKEEDKRYDAVTLWHVMEHIHDIHALWDHLYRILDDNGIAIIALPNSQSYDAEYYRENWAAYDVPRHLWHFAPSTIMKLGEQHDFILERRYPMPFDGFYISMLSERYKKSRLANIRGMWNGFLGWIATFDKCNASSSIIYIFRKRR